MDHETAAKALAVACGLLLKDTEGLVIELDDQKFTITNCDNLTTLRDVTEDENFDEHNHGQLLWVHDSQEEADAAIVEQKTKELH